MSALKNDHQAPRSRKRRFRPSKSLMRDMIEAARAAGITDPMLDIKPDGTLTVRSRDVLAVTVDEKKKQWQEAIRGENSA